MEKFVHIPINIFLDSSAAISSIAKNESFFTGLQVRAIEEIKCLKRNVKITWIKGHWEYTRN
uniref:RNase H type-1 domain-containing protein n=1 Tax=Lepeophtheirus salmonis TaxID=72036 RepID=A0A0K2VCX7_LEPSM